jgi:hypothetical protein
MLGLKQEERKEETARRLQSTIRDDTVRYQYNMNSHFKNQN